MKNFILLTTFLSLSLCVHAADDLSSSSLEDIMNLDSELKADVGSRSGAKNFLDSNAPVDVVTFKQIEHSGLTSLSDVLRYFVAGFNTPETSVADGTDHIRTFTLRGMSPDQVLVLINGKRVHTSALLHVNGTIGRGSSNVDLDTIAISSIEKIEILRDGAAAQYGSDAISGVINIILKGIGHNDSLNIHSGIRKNGDGLQIQADTFISSPLKYDGFINFTLSARKQEQTNRTGEDIRLSPPSKETHVGIPDSSSYSAVLNAEIPQSNNVNIYTNAIFNYRDSDASAFFRPSSDNSTPIYTAGFLPIINAKILDYSFVAGVSSRLFNNIDFDLSNTFGSSSIDFYVNGSMNYALAELSPTSFDNGSLNFTQNSTNLDLKKNINRLKLAAGAEYRYESYEIKAGENPSYFNGGSQGFSGYRPENEIDKSRTNYAFYFDGIYDFNNDVSLESALRYENYTDFGSTSNIKLSLSYKATPKLLLRSSASTGFRAPSLAQSYYSHTSSFGGLIEGTFRPDHEVSQVFGAKELKAEDSRHFTFGTVYQPTNNMSFMADCFYVKVDDRIMLSNEFVATTPEQVSALSTNGVNKARFFTNAINTETKGIDFKFNYKYKLDNNSKLDFGLWYNYVKNKVIGFNDSFATRLNSFEQIDRVENGQPKESIKILTNYEINKFNIALNLNKYGLYKQVRGNQSYKFESAWTTDLDFTYRASKSMNIGIGGNNIFNTNPNKWDGLSATDTSPYYGNNGIKPYSRYSPFGYSGSYYYFKISLSI